MFDRKRFLTIPEAAKNLGVNEETVRRHVRSGRLKAEKVGNQWFVHEEDLGSFANNYDPRTGPVNPRRLE